MTKEVKKEDKPLGYDDMCLFMCIVCASLITYLLITSKWFMGSMVQMILTAVFSIYLITLILYRILEKTVKSSRKKRKAAQS